jgi:predicted DNA binding CopG/RHH family protein
MKTKLISKRTIKTSEDMLTLRLSSKLMKSITISAIHAGLTRSNFCRIILEKAVDNK